MKQLPIIRHSEELEVPGGAKGPRMTVVSKVPRTVPDYPVAADLYVLQDPDGYPIFDTDGLHIYDNVTPYA